MTTVSLQEEFVTLNQTILDAQNRVREIRSTLITEFHKELPTFVLPYDTELNWWGTLSDVVRISGLGELYVHRTSGPSIRSGRDARLHRAGSVFKVVDSWKTTKRTKGSHYLLAQPRSRRPSVTHYYG